MEVRFCQCRLFALEPQAGPAHLDVAACTDRGRVRPINEDSYCLSPEQNLFVLSDGLGGAAKGEVASALAVEAVSSSLRENTAAEKLGEPRAHTEFSEQTNSLVRAVQQANRRIHDQGLRDPACRGMGATIVAARVIGSRLSLAHVGDSRAYLLRSGS